MKKFLALLIVASVLVSGLMAETSYSDKGGGFSYTIPEKWTLKEFPGLKYKVAIAEAKDNFGRNINIVDEEFAGPLDDYIAATKTALEKYFEDYHLLGQRKFITSGGLEGVKMTVESQQQKLKLRQQFYIFNKGTRFFVATCSALAADGNANDAIFDGSMKTFKLLE